MPLTPFQNDVLKLLASNRQLESHLAGGIAINRSSSSPRFSTDIVFFHDTPNVASSAEKDAELLRQHGFDVTWSERQESFQRAQVRRDGVTLKVEWCRDSQFRFFPVQPDPEFGFCLHTADLATNKTLTLAARSEVRDFIDITYLHETYLSLGALAWAACGKDQGFTPRSLLDLAKRHMRFREEQLAREILARPLSLLELKDKWLKAVDQAELLFARLPLPEVGCLYLKADFTPVTPEPANPDFPSLIRHYGSIRGAWPAVA
jgi:hypothetical protein